MSFNNKNNDFDALVDQDIFLQDMDSHALTRNDREIFPEFSEPIDYPNCTPLKNSSNFNVKQGMKFINKDNISNQRFQPYKRPSTSNKTVVNNENTFYRPNILLGNQNTTDKEKKNSIVKEAFKMSSFHTNNEQKMPFNMVKNNPSTSRSNFVMESTKSSARVEETRQTRQRMNLPGSRFRHLIGSVDQVLRWHKSVKNSDLCVMYEANGILECKRTQENKHLLFIRGESGHILQGVFYEIDRPMPICTEKSPIVVTGRMIGFRKMQVFDIVPLNQDYQAIQRLSFLSQRALNEALE